MSLSPRYPEALIASVDELIDLLAILAHADQSLASAGDSPALNADTLKDMLGETTQFTLLANLDASIRPKQRRKKLLDSVTQLLSDLNAITVNESGDLLLMDGVRQWYQAGADREEAVQLILAHLDSDVTATSVAPVNEQSTSEFDPLDDSFAEHKASFTPEAEITRTEETISAIESAEPPNTEALDEPPFDGDSASQPIISANPFASRPPDSDLTPSDLK